MQIFPYIGKLYHKLQQNVPESESRHFDRLRLRLRLRLRTPGSNDANGTLSISFSQIYDLLFQFLKSFMPFIVISSSLKAKLFTLTLFVVIYPSELENSGCGLPTNHYFLYWKIETHMQSWCASFSSPEFHSKKKNKNEEVCNMWRVRWHFAA